MKNNEVPIIKCAAEVVGTRAGFDECHMMVLGRFEELNGKVEVRVCDKVRLDVDKTAAFNSFKDMATYFCLRSRFAMNETYFMTRNQNYEEVMKRLKSKKKWTDAQLLEMQTEKMA